MIYLDNTSIQQTVYVPRRGLDGNTVSASLRLVSTIDLTEYVVPVQDQSVSEQYFLVSLALPQGVQSGEYEYAVLNNLGKVIAQGVCVVLPAPLGPTPLEYDTLETTQEFQQYEEGNIE